VAKLLDAVKADWLVVTRVFVCDDRLRARAAFTRMLVAAMPSVTDLVCVMDGHELLSRFADGTPDLVLIGVHEGSGLGPAAVSQVHQFHPAATILAYGSSDDSASLISAVALGARGILVWDPHRPTADLAGQQLVIGDRVGAQRDRRKPSEPPTERELQILRGMSLGHSNSEIGRELYLSEDTVKTHARKLFQKLGARDRAHAVALGLREYLLA
jgi:DNA-binding NarL/FixJ family response regulator